MTTHELHDEAMRLIERADRLNEKAFSLERRAAMRLLKKTDKEPTRAILFKGAAMLAIRCGFFNYAEEMARYGLAGNPPAEIKAELEEVLKLALAATK